VPDWPDWVHEAAEREAANYVQDTFSRLELLLAAASVGVYELDYDPATGEIGFWGGHANVADYDGKVTIALRAALHQAAREQEARAAELAEQAERSRKAPERVEQNEEEAPEREQTIERSLAWKVPSPQVRTPERKG
jgi:hypothetical protein